MKKPEKQVVDCCFPVFGTKRCYIHAENTSSFLLRKAKFCRWELLGKKPFFKTNIIAFYGKTRPL